MSPYLERELDPRACDVLEAHLSGCPPCRRELAALRASVDLVRGLTPPETPAHLADRTLARLRESPGRGRGAWRLAPGLLAAGFAALVVIQLARGPSEAPPALLEPTTLPELDLDPLLGAPDAGETDASVEAQLDARLDALASDPDGFLAAWRSLPEPSRDGLAAALGARARARGDAEGLADALRATGAPDAERLAQRIAAD
jgi:hypothetical protein